MTTSPEPAPSGSTADDGLLVFVHIRKTAGYTLRTILQRQYGRATQHVQNYFTKPELSIADVRSVAAAVPPGIRVVHGHILMWPDVSWPENTRFCTLLRDPVERTISHFFWLEQRSGKSRHTLEEAVTTGVIPDNMQTRVLGASNPPFGEMTDEMLDQAVQGLDRFTVVGITERFDESLMLLTREFGWRRMLYARVNVTRERQPREEIPAGVLEAIEHHNRLDLELYARACERFERDIAAQGDDFAIEVAALQRANTRFTGPEGAAELDPLPSSIADGADDQPVDLRELVIESQANLLLREEARLALLEQAKQEEAARQRAEEQAGRLEARLRAQLAARRRRGAAQEEGEASPAGRGSLEDRAAALAGGAEAVRARLREVEEQMQALAAAESSGDTTQAAQLQALREEAAGAEARIQALEARSAKLQRKLGSPDAATPAEAKRPPARASKQRRRAASEDPTKSDTTRERAAEIARKTEVATTALTELQARIAELQAKRHAPRGADGTQEARSPETTAELRRLRRRARRVQQKIDELDERREAIERTLAARHEAPVAP